MLSCTPLLVVAVWIRGWPKTHDTQPFPQEDAACPGCERAPQ